MRYFWLGILVSTMMLAACGDDDSDFATRPDGKESSSSSVILSGDSHEGSSPSSSSSSSEAKSSSSSIFQQSSSSATSVSSSSIKSSSSKVPEPEGGVLTDSRDGQTYKTVTIGTQTWMAENLNYAGDSSGFCYNDSVSYCEKYGRLYTWAAAMDSAGTWATNGKGCGYNRTCWPTYPVRGVCPEGWHLPTRTEWNTLFTAVGGQSTAGKMLKSTSGWNSSGNGTDAYSFSALPAGYMYYNGYFNNEGNYAYFWSSSEYSSHYAYYVDLNCRSGNAYLSDDNNGNGFSVRCVKD